MSSCSFSMSCDNFSCVFLLFAFDFELFMRNDFYGFVDLNYFAIRWKWELIIEVPFVFGSFPLLIFFPLFFKKFVLFVFYPSPNYNEPSNLLCKSLSPELSFLFSVNRLFFPFFTNHLNLSVFGPSLNTRWNISGGNSSEIAFWALMISFFS